MFGVLVALFLSSSLESRSSAFHHPSMKMMIIFSPLQNGSVPSLMSYSDIGRPPHSTLRPIGSCSIVRLGESIRERNRLWWNRYPWRSNSIRRSPILTRRKPTKLRHSFDGFYNTILQRGHLRKRFCLIHGSATLVLGAFNRRDSLTDNTRVCCSSHLPTTSFSLEVYFVHRTAGQYQWTIRMRI